MTHSCEIGDMVGFGRDTELDIENSRFSFYSYFFHLLIDMERA